MLILNERQKLVLDWWVCAQISLRSPPAQRTLMFRGLTQHGALSLLPCLVNTQGEGH